MKKILIVFLSLFTLNQSYAQLCDITAFSLQAPNLDCGDSIFIEFTAYGSLALSETFTSGGPNDTNWVSLGGAIFSNPYIPSPSNDDYFWMGPSAATPTALTTISYDVSGGGQVCFDFVYADGNSGAYVPPAPYVNAQGNTVFVTTPEQPDLYNEGITLQYNNGAGWIDIIYYPPSGGTLPNTPTATSPSVGFTGGAYEVWTSVCVDIPIAAMTSSTSFQWVQENNSGGCCDHWGLDNIVISTANPTYNIHSVESGQNLGPSPVVFGALPTTDSTFNFFYTAGLADTCYTSFDVTINPTNAGPDMLLDCNQNVVQLQGTGVSLNDNFFWSPPLGLTNTTILNPSASPLDTIDYVLNSSCGADTMTVNVVSNYSFSTSGDTSICIGDTAFLEVFGGAESYTWTPNNGSISDPTIANPFFTPTATTTYTVVSDSAGCIKTSSMTVYVSNKRFALLLTNAAGCSGGLGGISSVANQSLGPITYYLDNGFAVDTQANGFYSGLSAGMYTLTAVDSMSACPIDSSFTITGGLNINIDSIQSINPLCLGDTNGSIEVFIDTNVLAMYSVNGGPPQTSNIFTGLTDGVYNISASFGTCPPATISDTLAAPISVDALLIDNTDLTCIGSADGELFVSAAQGVGPYTYSLDNFSYQTDSFFIGLDDGSFQVFAMDNNGCIDSVTTFLSEPLPLILNNDVVNPALCFGDTTGSISFGVTNGIAPFQYSIDSGLTYQSSSTFTGLSAGSYYLRATDASGCFSNIINAIVTEPAIVSLQVDSTTDATCGNPDGVIYLSATGGTNTFSYSIDTGASFQPTLVFDNLSAGFYQVFVEDANGCDATIDTSIINVGSPTLSISSFDSVLCFGESNATVQLSAVGGSLPYSFSIDNGLTLQPDSVFSNLSAGVNNFMVIDAIGCEANVSITIFEPNLLDITATQDSTSCFGFADGEIIALATGGSMPYSYAVGDTAFTQTSASLAGYAAGTYMTYVVDANLCVDSVNQTVLQADSIIINNIQTTDVVCFGDADGIISFDATGGVGAYNYSINSGVSSTLANVFTVDTGTYNLFVEDALGCESVLYTATVNQPLDLELDSVNSITTNCGLANGSLEVIASGGIAPYTYSLNGGIAQNAGLFANVSAMNHTIIVTDANDCTETITIIVDSIPNLALNVLSFDSVSCGGDADASVTVVATGGEAPYSYTVNGGIAQSSATFTGLSGGNNVFVVSDAIGNCTATVTENIYEPVTLTLSATQDSASCNNASLPDGQITLTATGGGMNYLYALNDSMITQSTNVFGGLGAGVNVAYVIDENGCSASVNQSVLEPDTLIILGLDPVNISCDAEGSFTVTAQGGTSPYLYNLNGSMPMQASNVFSIVAPGTYTLGVTDANGCPLATMIDSITEPESVSFLIDSATAALECNNLNNAFIGLSASGGSAPYTYSLNGGAAYQLDSFFTALSAGSYTLLVRDVFGCESAPTTIVITQPNALAGTTSANGVSCNGETDGSISINTITGGTAPYSVTVNGVTDVFTAGMMFDLLAAGNYPILITDANNCNLTLNETVADVSALVLTANAPTNVSCFGASDGAITVSATGGTANYDFTISLGSFSETINSASSATFLNLEGSEAGLNYTISVIDVNGCSSNTPVTITQPNQLLIEGIDTSALSCFGANDATLSARVSGGSEPYTYVWTPSGQNSSLASGLAPGVYSVAVTDANNCTITASQTILDVAPVLATVVPDSAMISMGDTTNLGVNVENAIGTNLIYAWSPAEGLSCTDCSNPVVTVYNDIAYSVVVTDENGCTSFNFTEVFVTVDRQLFYFIPSAFSPGNDGINDVFQVLGQDIQSVDLTVYNRWGEKVFDGSNQYISWDGTFKGELQSPGVYSYVVKITFLNDEEVLKKGSVTLLR